jgi:hypothetical protein
MNTEADIVETEMARLRAERDALQKSYHLAVASRLEWRRIAETAAREMRERCAGWHDAQATICRDVAKANQGNEVGSVFHALVVDHEVAADAIRALPDTSSAIATERAPE